MSGLKGLIGGQYQPLSKSSVERIHQASLEIFEEVGFEVHYEAALEIFAENGAKVDSDKKRVRLSPRLVEKAIGSAPSKVILHGREEKHDLTLEDKRVYFGTGGTAIYVIDLESGERRLSNLEDVKQIAKLVDALENIHFFMLPVFPHELSQELIDPNRFYTALSNTTKHVTGGVWHPEGVNNAIKLASILTGGYEKLREKPIISMICCVISPLKLDKNYTELMLAIAENGIPVIVPSEALCGATSPITLAGDILQVNVETLAGVILTQLVNPGTPVLYGTVSSIADPRHMSYTSGAVEMGLINAAVAQMAQFYGIPFYATAGMSDSKLPDIQAGYEKAVTSLLVALAGANYIHDSAGLLEFAMTACYEQYVIDDEINGMVMRALRGVEFNEDTLALNVIKDVGPTGTFFDQNHTVKHLRRELFFPKVSDRLPREEWEQKGAKDGRERAREMAKNILENHQPIPVPS
ncbi:MAG: trimethylamine methyltransferase family protein, partial [Dehalococcoidales bacterium]